MKKDVIYVDIEDDITSIIEKVKTANASIIALVPPKRIGVLQSVVNLKLLQRAAQSANKRVVMITNDQSLTALAAGVLMPVAKNLQSKPEIASVTALEVDDEDIINGDELPIGDLAATVPLGPKALDPTTEAPVRSAPLAALAASRAPKKMKIPNFDDARKKIFIFGGAGLALVLFLVWAVFFAPNATISVAAQTTAYNIAKPLNLSMGASLDADQGTTPVVIKEIQKTKTIDFAATGKKDVGEKAKGTISLVNSTESDPVFVAAGSRFTTATGLQFVSDSDVTVPGAKFVGGTAKPAGTGTVAATASEIGESYNVGPQSLISNDVTIGAKFDAATSGGSKRQVTVVTTADVDKAKEQLKAQDANSVKTDLKSQFESDIVSIDESFTVTPAEPTVSPAVDQEATTAKLTSETKYLILGIAKSNLQKILEADINQQLKGLPNQKIYDSGINKVKFSNFVVNQGGAFSADVEATGDVGPNIDATQLAKQSSGRRAGEIQAQVQTIDGVESVDVKLSPFWVTSAPKAEKITVKFLVKNETN